MVVSKLIFSTTFLRNSFTKFYKSPTKAFNRLQRVTDRITDGRG